MTVDLARDAIRLLEDAINKPPAELKAEVDVAERAIAALRDALIERLRSLALPLGEASSRGEGSDSLHTALDRVNAALSLVVAVEYPSGGVQRDMLDQARQELQATLDAGLPT